MDFKKSLCILVNVQTLNLERSGQLIANFTDNK